MKKLLGVVIIFVAAILLTACRGGRELDHELDFRSVLDVDSDTVLRLGDSLSDFENALGSGLEMEAEWFGDRENFAIYSFANGILEVFFLDGEAVSITQTEESARFQFLEMSFDMTAADIYERFIALEYDFDFVAWYDRFYDSNGREVSNSEEADYIATITYRLIDILGNDTDEGILRLNISRTDWH